MTKAKTDAIRSWQEPTIPSTTDIVEDNFGYSKVAEDIRAEANKAFIDDLDTHLGIKFAHQFEDIIGGPLKSASLQEMREYLVAIATDGRFYLDMPEGVDKLVLNKVMNGWRITSDLDIKSLMKTIKKYNPEFTDDQVDLFSGVFRDTDGTYRELVGEFRDEAHSVAIEASKLKVTPGERINRIQLGTDATEEELKLRFKSIDAAVEHVNSKYDLNLYPQDFPTQAHLREAILEDAAGKPLNDLAWDVIREIEKDTAASNGRFLYRLWRR